MAAKIFSVPNISCGHCTMTIERELRDLEGVTGIDAHADTKSVSVTWNEPATEDRIRSLLAEINYPAEE